MKNELNFIQALSQIENSSTCAKKKVGCIIGKNNKIISSGVNRTFPNAIKCNELYRKFENDVEYINLRNFAFKKESKFNIDEFIYAILHIGTSNFNPFELEYPENWLYFTFYINNNLNDLEFLGKLNDIFIVDRKIIEVYPGIEKEKENRLASNIFPYSKDVSNVIIAFKTKEVTLYQNLFNIMDIWLSYLYLGYLNNTLKKYLGFENNYYLHHDWSNLNEIHAEMDAIFSVDNLADLKDSDFYISFSPCFNCAKLIRLIGCKRVFFKYEYDGCDEVLKFLKDANIKVYKYIETKKGFLEK